MLNQPVVDELRNACNLGTLYGAYVGADVANTGTLNFVLKPAANLNSPNRCRVRVSASCETGGFLLKLLTGVTYSSGTDHTPLPLNRNYASRTWGGQVCKHGATISASTTSYVKQAGPGVTEFPPLELAADTVVAFELENVSGATARATLNVEMVMV